MTHQNTGNHMKDHKFAFPESVWAGTDHSLLIAMDVHAILMAGLYDQPAQDAPEVPYGFTKQGDVGIISVRGSLVNREIPSWAQGRGMTGYPDIAKALVHGATEAGVKALLLDIDSGGGAVAGVDDTSTLIKQIDKSIMPVYAFTGGTMASAAYWLGASARGVYVSQTAMSGSIGVIATHQEYSKLFKEMGIGVTVVRAGEYKALANSMEPLSEVAKKQLQDQLNAAYAVFIGHVAESRGVSVAVADQTIGQGREFFGVAAVDAGLVDGLKTFDSMMSMINAKLIDTSAQREQTAINFPRGQNMPRQALTEQNIAAIAAGAATGASASTEGAAAIEEAVAAEAASEAAVVATAPTAADTSAPLVTYLQGQVKDKDATILAQSLELNTAKAQVESMQASHAGLVKIAATSLSNMKVGMGMRKADYSAMAPDQLLAEHDTTAKAFTEHFKVGGVAAVEAPEAGAAAELDPLHMLRIAATRLTK